ncbi:MAG TPA: hypothetical protein V6D21_21840 [Candidatus Obscuribacterales bacterium]
MNALTAIAATVYAVTLWIFAPESVWRREVKQAKHNQQNRLTATPEPIPQPKPETIQTLKTELKSTIKAIPEATPQLDTTPEATEEPEAIAQQTPEPEAIPEAIEQAILKPTATDYTGWTITKLRDEAKSLKLNWRPLINGKRKPLNKPQLIQLLTT